MVQLEIPKKRVVLAVLKDRWNQKTSYVTMESITNFLEWAGSVSVEILNREPMHSDFSKLKLFKTDVYRSRCFVSVKYQLESEKKLSDRDFEILKSIGAFMEGQITGHIVKVEEIEGKFIYSLTSECDSGD